MTVFLSYYTNDLLLRLLGERLLPLLIIVQFLDSVFFIPGFLPQETLAITYR